MAPELSGPPQLELRLLGAPEIALPGGARAFVSSAKASALLYYLAVTGRAHTRASLASLLWGDLPDATARGNLRKALGDLTPVFAPYLVVERQTVSWRLDSASWVDVRAFVSDVGDLKSGSPADWEHLNHALALYRGDFLEGFHVRAAPDFESWMLAERARLRELVVAGMEALALAMAQQRDLTQAIAHARHLLAIEPWREETHRQLMEWLALNGQRSAALAQYELCRRALAEELDVEPDPTTQELYQRLLHLEQSEQAGRTLPVTSEYTLVGRRSEWQRLVSTWQKTVRGAAHFVVLRGEAGIGKTRLAEELLVYAQRQGHVAARSRAYAIEGRLAYGPVTDWLRGEPLQTQVSQLADVWLTELARLLPELLVAHPHLSPPQPLTERWQQKRFLEALAQAFTAARLPLLLVLDDLQWCDPETLEWLHYLLQATPRARLLIVGTVRPEEVDADHPLLRLWVNLERDNQLSTVDLAPLNAEETAALANQIAHQSPNAEPNTESAIRLYAETAGNPLFVIESIRASAEQRDASRIPSSGRSLNAGENVEESYRLPPKIHAVIRERLLRLSPQARELAQLAATVGRTFTTDLLLRAGERSEESVLAALDELWRRRIVREVGVYGYDFSHDRIRDGAYLEAGPIQRRLLHHRVAKALQELHADDVTPVAGELGVHCERAGLLAEASNYYRQAAQSARQLFARREVVDYLAKALNVLELLPNRSDSMESQIELLLELGVAQIPVSGWGSGPVGQIWQKAYELATLAGSTFHQCRALLGLSQYHRNRSEWNAVRPLTELNLALVQKVSDPFLRECVLATRFTLLYHAGDPAQALRISDQVLTPTRTKPIPSFGFAWTTDNLPHFLLRSGKCLWLLGFPDQARLRCDEAVRLAYHSSELFTISLALDFSAMAYSFCRDAHTVHRLGKELLQFAAQHEFPFYVRAGEMFMGWALAQQGDAGTGAAMIRASVDKHRSDGTRMFEPYWRGLLAEALALDGQTTDALSEVEDALAFAEESGNRYWNAHLLKLKADYLQALGFPTGEVEQWYERAVATAQGQGARSLELRATLGLSRLWQQQGKQKEAYNRLAPLYTSFTEGLDTADLQEAKLLLADLCG